MEKPVGGNSCLLFGRDTKSRDESSTHPDCVHRTTAETMYSGMLEANGEDVAEWIRSPGFEYNLFSFFPCTDILPSTANQVNPLLPEKCPRYPSLTSTFTLSDELSCWSMTSAIYSPGAGTS